MKKSYDTKWKKWFVILLIGYAFMIGPTITAQLTPSSYEKDTGVQQRASHQRTGPSVYDLLIITPEQFVQALQPLVVHKNTVGIRTKLVTLSEVYHQMYWQGRDCAEKIKYFIKTAKEEWGITYVLLVGDFQTIPVRYCFNADNNTFWDEPCFISELYYADLFDKNGNFSSWDTNGNGVYGEWFGDVATDKDIDLYPDVYVGRLACHREAEVKIMVHKIITYETTSFEQEWFHRIVVAGGDTYPASENPNWTAYEGEENTLRVLENMSGFEATKLWTSDGTLSGPNDMIQAVSKGCGFFYLDGHANAFEWSTHPPNDGDTWINGLTVLSMSRLRNKEMLPICVVGGCHNNEFDVTPWNIIKGLREEGLSYFQSTAEHFGSFWKYTWVTECWGWKLTRTIGGGSIATIGCTGLGMTKEDKQSFSGAGDFLEPTFFYEYGVNGTDILGETWGKTITDYLNAYTIDWNTPAMGDCAIDAKTVQQWALLGDPSLKIGGYQL
jgi:hypothetical protein